MNLIHILAFIILLCFMFPKLALVMLGVLWVM